MNTWQYILEKLSAGEKVMLLYVVKSEGSSPGRQGFKMAVSTDGSFSGTIGGGIMEHKLVEKAKELLKTNAATVTVLEQYHDKEHTKNQSGMICSGKQTILFVPLDAKDRMVITAIISAMDQHIESCLVIDANGLRVADPVSQTQFVEGDNWSYTEILKTRHTIHIIGGGHVSLAFSELMHYLEFYVKVYDDRTGLNTMASNHFADEKVVVDYDRIGEYMQASENDHVVIMTMGYRDDLRVFRQLMHKRFSYLGMLGSESKIESLFAQLESEGIDTAPFKNYFIPVGLNIYSKTPKEIAVSIAAQIILEKNKHQPTGRKSKPAMHEN